MQKMWYYLFFLQEISNFISLFFKISKSHIPQILSSVVENKYPIVTAQSCSIQLEDLNDPTRQLFELCQK